MLRANFNSKLRFSWINAIFPASVLLVAWSAKAQNASVDTKALPAPGAQSTSNAASIDAPSVSGPGQNPSSDAVSQQVTEEAVGVDAVTLLKKIADERGVSLSILGNPTATVTVSLRNASVEDAISFITASAGLSFQRHGQGYLIGSPAELAQIPGGDGESVAVYRCRHVNAASLAATLSSVFDPTLLKVMVGPTYLSPSLTGVTSNDTTGFSESFNPLLPQQGDDQLRTPEVILSGGETLIQRALKLCEQLDRRRAQVRLKLNISDVSYGTARELGLQYNFGDLTFSETTPVDASGNPLPIPGLQAGRFNRTGLSINATLAALESSDRAKVLAQPTLSLLDGERSFILIGQRQIFPVLTNYSTVGTPIFSTQEVRVGIYIQVAAQIGDDNEVILSIYPQVSSITGFVEIAGTRYPQIATREQQTTVRARSGETFILGGLIRDSEVKSIQGVPLISRIPILGELFKYRNKTRNRSELIVAVTPEIIDDASTRVKDSLPKSLVPQSLVPQSLWPKR